MTLMRFEDFVALKHQLLPYMKENKKDVIYLDEYNMDYGFHCIIHISDCWKIDEDEIIKIIDSYYI